jgi:transcriptional regulator with XRE-family HTH domain
LSLIESGRRDPTLSTLEVIARGLEIPLSMLVFLAADSDELSAMSPEVKEKLSSAILALLQATNNDHQSTLI